MVFQIIGIVLPTEQTMKSFTFISQGLCLNFTSAFTIFNEFMNDVWNDSKRSLHDHCF